MSNLKPLLLVDVGNTAIHWAPYDGEWGADRRLWTRAIETFGAQYDSEIKIERSRRQPCGWPEVAVICSVVPDATERITAELERRHMRVLLLGHTIWAPMEVRYADPNQLGQDRLANGVAAFERIGGACIVVDVGTAITVDAISPGGVFLGGAIVPGPHRAWRGFIVGVHGPGFAMVDTGWLEHRPRGDVKPIGHSTQECLDAGLRLGFAGLIDRLIREQRRELGISAPVLWTGGVAPLLRPHSDEPGELDELLTLRGLASIYTSYEKSHPEASDADSQCSG
ncbi:MAG: type III pantothenate kinase [Candidatus Zipacnadales bacterium]